MVHLKPLEREKKVEWWADTKIKPGTPWREDIKMAIDTAKIAVLLISADFFASDFIAEYELPPILRAAEKEGLKILSVILGPSRFINDKSLSEIQSINNPRRPLKALRPVEREQIWAELMRHIETALSEPSQEPAAGPDKNHVAELTTQYSDPPMEIDIAPAIGVFVNRHEYIRDVSEFLLDSSRRLVIIQGLPGIGKTTLSAKLADQHKQKFKGVFWLNCKKDEATSDILFSKLNQFFEENGEQELRGIWKDPRFAQLEIKINKLIYILTKNSYLIILDEFQNWLSESHQIKNDELRKILIKILGNANQSKIIMITDERIAFDPSIFHIPTGAKLERTLQGFDQPYAIQFLKEIGLSIENHELATRIISHCGGNPYMLQVFAYLANDLYMDIDDLLSSDEIKSKFEKLLHVAIETLSPASRDILEQLGVFRLPLSKKSLKEVDVQFEVKIKPLLDKFLLIADKKSNKYEISKLVQVHLKDTLPETRLKELHISTAEIYKRIRENLVPKTYEDLQYAIEEGYHEFEYGDYERGAGAIISTLRFLIDWGYIELASYKIQEILNRVSTPVIEAQCFWYKGLIDDLRGDYPSALDHFNKVLQLYQSANDYNGQANTFLRIGRIYNALNLFDQANDYYTKCINTCREKGVTGGWAASLLDMGWNVQEKSDDFEQAISLYTQSISQAEISGDLNTLSSAHRQIGFLLWTKKKEKDNALQHFKTALTVSEENNLVKETGAIYLEMGYIYEEMGEFEKARLNCNKSIEIFSAIGNSYGLSSAYMNLGKVYESEQDFESAIEWYNKSRTITLSLNNPGGQAWACLQLGRVLYKQVKLAEAEAVLLKAIDLSKTYNLREISMSAQDQLSKIKI